MKKIMLIAVVLIFSMAFLTAQTIAEYTFSTTADGTLQDMTGSTDLLTTSTYHDDHASPVTNIGFTFSFGAGDYTQFSANSNGQMQLGATAISGGEVSPEANIPRLAPLSGDNAIRATGRLHYLLTGTAPNRKLVVEWLDLRVPYGYDAESGTYCRMQAWLYEGSNNIKFVYGQMYNMDSYYSHSRGVYISTSNVAGSVGNVTDIINTMTWTNNGTSVVTTSFPGNSAMANLNSTADGARRVFHINYPVYTTPPNPAVLLSPANGSYAMLTDVLSWQRDGGGTTSYDVYFGTDPNPPFVVNQIATTYTPTLAAGTTYYWNIVARNEHGAAAATATWSFKIPAADQLVESFENTTFPPAGWANPGSWSRSTSTYNHGLASAYKSPYDASLYILSTPKVTITGTSDLSFMSYCSTTSASATWDVVYTSDRVTWTQVPGSAFTHPTANIWVQRQIDLSSLAGHNYYLGIRAGGYSDASFYVDKVIGPAIIPEAPGALVLNTPADLATNVNEYPTFTWTAPTIGGFPTGYRLYVGTVNPPTTMVVEQATLSYTCTAPLAYNTTYYWTVEAYNGVGAGPQATVRSFTTRANPLVSTFPYAVNFDTETPPALPLNWVASEAVAGATQHWKTTTTDASQGASAPHSTPNFAYLDCYWAVTNYNPYYLTTPPMSLGSDAKRISYWYWIGTDTVEEPLMVEISTDQVNWTNLFTHSNTSNTLAWYQNQISLSAYANETVYIRFSGISNYGTDMTNLGLDDIVVENIPSAPIFSINPTSHDYGQVQPGDSEAQIFTITNTGLGTLCIDKDDITITGTDADLFTLNPIAEDISLGGTATAQITVNFAPVAEGMFSASLQIIDNLAGGKFAKRNGDKSTHLIPLTGEGHDASISTFPFAESFEGDIFPPVGWITADLDGGGSYWESTNDMNHSESGSKCAIHDYSADIPDPGQNGWLISPPIVIPAGTDLNLSFWNFNDYNTYYVYNGVLINSTPNPDAPGWVEIWSPEAVEEYWVNASVSLSAYAGQTVYLAFVYQGYDADSWYLDDISITESFDYPEDTPVVVGDNTITISGGNANNGTGEIPPVNNVAFTASASFYLELLGAGPWTITFETDAPWGAYYQGGHWYAVQAVDGVISFVITASKDLGIPIVLGSVDPTLPVELSSFTAVLTSDMFVNIAWINESETNHAGYNIYRSETDQMDAALKLNSIIIDEGIAQGSQIRYLFTDYEAYQNMEYYYWLESMSLDGVSEFFGPLKVIIGDPTQEPIAPAIPMVTKLLNAFPNPFNPNTNLRYSLKEAGNVRIDVYNLKGQLIRSFQNSHNTPGFYQVAWDGRDTNGQLVSSGIYMYRMTSGKYNATKKMILAK